MSSLPALLAQGRVVTVCCGDHRPAGCCGDACVPCCAECTTCPAVAIEQCGRVTIAALDELEFDTLRVIEVVTVFDPDGLAEAHAELVDLDFDLPHLEGRLA